MKKCIFLCLFGFLVHNLLLIYLWIFLVWNSRILTLKNLWRVLHSRIIFFFLCFCGLLLAFLCRRLCCCWVLLLCLVFLFCRLINLFLRWDFCLILFLLFLLLLLNLVSFLLFLRFLRVQIHVWIHSLFLG